MAVKAVAPERCDICEGKLRDKNVFYDGRLRGRLQWAWLCKDCFAEFGFGLGTGKGQEYDSKTDMKLRG